MKRSGYPSSIFAIFQAIVQFKSLSPHNVAETMNESCIKKGVSFQKINVMKFKNPKSCRRFPDQPAFSRYLGQLNKLNKIESFWNSVQFAHLLILKQKQIIMSDLTLIADYTKESCRKNKDDPYCFGSKEGKTHHKTLTFSIISNGLHQIISNFKIKKRVHKLPYFEQIYNVLVSLGFTIRYILLDRGFYRKELLYAFKAWKMTVIMPGRKCAQTNQKIITYLLGKGKRYCKGFTKLKYAKGIGYPMLKFDLLLCAKRKKNLSSILRGLKANFIDLDAAIKDIFPLIVLIGNKRGINRLRGNETHIRNLYRSRWWIEIAFREMNRLGISTHLQDRNKRLDIMGAKSLVYNLWQVQRYLLKKKCPNSPDLELNMFLGKTKEYRNLNYIV